MKVVCVCVFILYMAPTSAAVLFARSQDSLMSVASRRIHAVFSTTVFKGGGKPYHKTGKTTTMRRGIQEASRS